MTTPHILIKVMDTKHDEAIEKIVGPLMEAMARITEIRHNYTGDDKDCRQFYRQAESDILNYLTSFAEYARTGTWEASNGEGDHP
jgi:hypothetical protein